MGRLAEDDYRERTEMGFSSLPRGLGGPSNPLPERLLAGGRSGGSQRISRASYGANGKETNWGGIEEGNQPHPLLGESGIGMRPWYPLGILWDTFLWLGDLTEANGRFQPFP